MKSEKQRQTKAKYDKSYKEKPENRLKLCIAMAIQRCYNPKNSDYKSYGARGITVCDEWRENRNEFVKWSLSHGFTKGLILDKIDNYKGYSPENCRWVTPAFSVANRRMSTDYKVCEEGRECKTCRKFLPWADMIRSTLTKSGHGAHCKRCHCGT